MSSRSEGVGHTLVISGQDMERIKAEVTAKITDVLPKILLEVVPDVITLLMLLRTRRSYISKQEKMLRE